MPPYRFLIDVNLPKYFGFFNSDAFEFVIDINGRWPDKDIWEFAEEHNLVIVTKDTDFYYRCMLDNGPVKVIYLKLGKFVNPRSPFFFPTALEYNCWSSPPFKDDNRDAKWPGCNRDLVSAVWYFI